MLFDFGGTLADCPPWMELELVSLISAVLARLARRGWPLPAQVDERLGREMLRHLRQVARETWMECPALRCAEAILPRLGVGVPPRRLLEEVLEEIYEGLVAQVEWLPGSRELLGELVRGGVRLGLVSNAAYAPFLHRVLARAGVRDLFRAVVISADLGWRKPHPAPFLRALTELGVSPGEALHVGDHWGQDILGAARAGLQPLWICGGPGAGGPAPGPMAGAVVRQGAAGGPMAGVVVRRGPAGGGELGVTAVRDLAAAGRYLLARLPGRPGAGPHRPGRWWCERGAGRS